MTWSTQDTDAKAASLVTAEQALFSEMDDICALAQQNGVGSVRQQLLNATASAVKFAAGAFHRQARKAAIDISAGPSPQAGGPKPPGSED